jgi:drug/metabolite transporter (DMT)-like permease
VDRVNDRRLGALAAGVTVITWAAAFPAIRAGLEGFTPWALGTARLVVASLTLGVAAVFLRPTLPLRRDWARVFVAGLVGQTLYQGLLMTGEVTVPAGTASILIATAPLFAMVFASVLLREPMRPSLPGMTVAFAGTALVGWTLGVGGGRAALIVLAAAACQGAYHVVVKPLADSLGAFPATAWSLWAGTALCLPLLPLARAEAHNATTSALLAVLVLGVVSSAIGYASWSIALRRASVATTTAVLYLVPVVALALGWLFLDERPSPVAVAGGGIAILGVVLTRSPATPAALWRRIARANVPRRVCSEGGVRADLPDSALRRVSRRGSTGPDRH